MRKYVVMLDEEEDLTISCDRLRIVDGEFAIGENETIQVVDGAVKRGHEIVAHIPNVIGYYIKGDL